MSIGGLSDSAQFTLGSRDALFADKDAFVYAAQAVQVSFDLIVPMPNAPPKKAWPEFPICWKTVKPIFV